MAGPPTITDGRKNKDLQWTNQLNLADFRSSYFFRVYGFLVLQYLIVGAVSYAFVASESVRENSRGSTELGSGVSILALISYGLLYVKCLNNPSSCMMSAIMQLQFTACLSLLVSLLSVTFQLYFLIYAAVLICLSCVVICASYRFSLIEYHHFIGIRIIFYLQSVATGGTILVILKSAWSEYDQHVWISNIVSGFLVSALMLIYFAFGSIRMMATRYVTYTPENFIFGTTLLYTTPIINSYYKKKAT